MMRPIPPRPCFTCRRKRGALLLGRWCSECFMQASSSALKEAGQAFFRKQHATWEGRGLETERDRQERQLRQEIRQALQGDVA